jgi:glucose-1-phosphate thymidylyltransferase
MLGEGSRSGISLGYAEQPKPEGVAQALIIGRRFVRADTVVLALGDDLFLRPSLAESTAESTRPRAGTKKPGLAARGRYLFRTLALAII